jgi:hypothetical protein
MSGLLRAAFDGELATIKRLLANGTASIDERNGMGDTASQQSSGSSRKVGRI